MAMKRVSRSAFVGDVLSDDEVTLVNHIREVQGNVAGPSSPNPGAQIGVVVVTCTQRYIFWRTATDLDTSEATKNKLSME